MNDNLALALVVVVVGESDGVHGGSDGVHGGSDGVHSGSDGVHGRSDGVRGGSDGVRGGSDVLRGGSDGVHGGSDVDFFSKKIILCAKGGDFKKGALDSDFMFVNIEPYKSKKCVPY